MQATLPSQQLPHHLLQGCFVLDSFVDNLGLFWLVEGDQGVLGKTRPLGKVQRFCPALHPAMAEIGLGALCIAAPGSKTLSMTHS
jgi:hypothetical protein